MAFKRSSNSAGGLQATFDSGTPAQKAAFRASVSGAGAAVTSGATRTPIARIYNKVRTINASGGRLAWLPFGDSLATKVYNAALPILQSLVGATVGNVIYGITTSSTSGVVTANTTAFDVWPSGLTETFSPGASRTYGVSGGPVSCDTIHVIYPLRPASGASFKIRVDGIDQAGFLNVSTDGALGTLGVATITGLSTAGGVRHDVTIVQVSGSPEIIGVGFIATTATGIVNVGCSQGGIPLNSPTADAWSNFRQYVALFTPDVISFEMKENSSYYASALASFGDAIDAAGVPTSVICIGSTPVAANDADQVAQNAILKTFADSRGYWYWDSYVLFKSYAGLQAIGWEGDGVHVAPPCDEFRAIQLLKDAGLLDLYGMNATQGGLPQRLMRLQGPNGELMRFRPESVFNLDAQLVLSRYLIVTNAAGTEIMRIDPSTGQQFIQQSTRIGGTNRPALASDSATMAGVRRGDAGGSPGDWRVRALVRGNASQSASGSVTVDASLGTIHEITLTGNITALAFSNVSVSYQAIELHLIQDSTGSRTLAGANASIKWAGGAAPTLTTTAGRRDIFRFTVVGGNLFEISRSMNVG